MSHSKVKALDDWAARPARTVAAGEPGPRPLTAQLAAPGSPAQPSAQATVADVMRPPVAMVTDTDHVAAAAYLMKRAGTAALLVQNDQDPGRPTGIVTEADIAQVVADGKDVNEVRIHEVMTAHPAAIPATASVRDAATNMLARGVRQLPVTGGERTGQADLIGVVDIADLCGALLVSFPGG